MLPAASAPAQAGEDAVQGSGEGLLGPGIEWWRPPGNHAREAAPAP